MNPALFANPALFQAYQNDPGMAYGQALMQQGASTAPVRSPLEGFARALQAGVGGFTQSKVRDKYEGENEKYRQALAAALNGGDVLGALQSSDMPQLQQMALDAKLRQALNPADDPLVKVYDPTIKAERYMKQSEARGLQASAPQEAKAPQTRQIHRNGLVIDQQFDPATGTFVDVGSGPQFAPQQAPAPPEVIRLLQAAGIDPKSPQGQTAIQHAMGIDQKPPQLMTLVGPDGSAISLDKSDPANGPKLNDLLSKGYVERSGADPNSKPFTEDQSKTAQLLTEVLPDVQIAQDNYKALEGTLNQVAGMGPAAASNLVTTPEYQRAKQAIAHIIANNLYSLSGAQITPAEADRRAALLMPTIGESQESIADKKARIQQLVEGMRARAGRAAESIQAPASVPPAPGAGSATAVPQPGVTEDGYRFKGGDPGDPKNWEKVQ